MGRAAQDGEGHQSVLRHPGHRRQEAFEVQISQNFEEGTEDGHGVRHYVFGCVFKLDLITFERRK